ncbi:MAG: pyruvate:ferredoxin (flavodoxin) oxidoreductase [Armatimonadetes bacterium]|nr:pyruvate:ferredoxin (flavodoxin) oxidoreductase [Armatimonadota bacterium]
MTRCALMDGNEAAASVAFRTNEVIAIYPITPASTMGELCDQWAAEGRSNLWGQVPRVVEMQSEGGAAGAVHGALQGGSLTTTFTASQGLLLMIPNMFKIAGELTSTVFYVAARALATQALSIFGDHSDVMAARATGFAMLFCSSVQEAVDLALVAQAATLEGRVPFLHVTDGFRTSHEIAKIELLSDEQLREVLDPELIRRHRLRALSPERPVIRGTAQNPDVFFQAREASNPYYLALPEVVQRALDRLGAVTGRRYRLFEYQGHPEAERVLVTMGSGAEVVAETVVRLASQGERVGAIQVRLYRPFSGLHLLAALPATARAVAVLDRCKEPGATGEPLYQDVVAALHQGGRTARVVGGRYGLSSKEFNPAMVRAIVEELSRPHPRHPFTVGIRDDVTGTSLEHDPNLPYEDPDTVRAVFWGLGSDGTVSANKNSIKIIGEERGRFAQGYFVYDSKKAGARTISHLRFGPRPIRQPYLIQKANFLAVHQFGFLGRFPVLEAAEDGAVLLLNSPYGPAEVWEHLPREVQKHILERKLRLYVVDAHRVAREAGLPGRINTVMQTCFFALSGVLPRDEALARIKAAAEKTYRHRGSTILTRNFQAIDQALEHLSPVPLEGKSVDAPPAPPIVPLHAPEFVREVLGPILAEKGDELPVSRMPADGTFPAGTARWEKRNLAAEVPVWAPELCIQCGKCILVCPHAVIRSKLVEAAALEGAPEGFYHRKSMWRDLPDLRYTLQVSVEDCTGCQLCVYACPAKDKSHPTRRAINMEPQPPLREKGRELWEFFLGLPEDPPERITYNGVKDVQLLQPLFEFSGACAGCGETPYLKLISQLFGEHAMVANATGCSSIYGGNLPTTPWSTNRHGRGPAWSNSLFEDNAEFGLGMRLALDQQIQYARRLVQELVPDMAPDILEPQEDLSTFQGREALRGRIVRLKERLANQTGPAMDLVILAEVLLPRSVWIVGGDGWAYDIGYGGLDHVLASGANVNLLVLDTEVYSNTGGQASKATPLGAVAKFAAAGKLVKKKDLGLIAMGYGNVYVAQVAMGASDTQTLKALLEAESYPGTSLVIAYSHCIAHGIDMTRGLEQQKLAAESGQWLLYRYDPRRLHRGQPALQLDTKGPRIPLGQYLHNEARFRLLLQANPRQAELILEEAQRQVHERWEHFRYLAGETRNGPSPPAPSGDGKAGAEPAPDLAPQGPTSAAKSQS